MNKLFEVSNSLEFTFEIEENNEKRARARATSKCDEFNFFEEHTVRTMHYALCTWFTVPHAQWHQAAEVQAIKYKTIK